MCIRDSRMTGYLSQKDAQAFRDRQRREELEGQSISCDAAIRGGAVWQNKHLAYAVWVDIELSR